MPHPTKRPRITRPCTNQPRKGHLNRLGCDANGNRTGGSTTLSGTTAAYTSAVPTTNNRPTTQAGINVVTNAAGDVTNLLGKAIAYDAAGRVSEVTAVPPCPTGSNCSGSQSTLSRYNGHNQRYLRDNPAGQTVFTYAPDGYSVLAEVQHTLIGATTVSNTTETVYRPTASGPMPVVALINGAPFAVYADHLNTPRRLTDAQGRPRWQWAFSGFGEMAAQSLPAAGKPLVSYSLRYPGQVDDGNGLFYNFNRFYDPLAGRYTSADPIGLQGGWNRFGYVGGNALGNIDPRGLDNPGMGPFGPPWIGVWRCERPINISWVGSASAALPNHNWLLTGSYESGMGARCPVPGQGCSDKPGALTLTLDHSGQSSQPGSDCAPVPNINEQCVSDAIRPGQSSGRWMPWNQCQSFTDEVLDRCSSKPGVPFMPRNGQPWR